MLAKAQYQYCPIGVAASMLPHRRNDLPVDLPEEVQGEDEGYTLRDQEGEPDIGDRPRPGKQPSRGNKDDELSAERNDQRVNAF